MSSLNEYADAIYEWAERKGWNKDFVLGNQVCNLHAEISEGWEEIRNNHPSNEVYFREDGKPEGFLIELIDLIIRALHMMRNIERNNAPVDVDALMRLKMHYNETRPYRHGGKAN